MKKSLAILICLLGLGLSVEVLAQAVGGGGSGGGGLRSRTLGARNPGCQDGSVQPFYEFDSMTGSRIVVMRECQGGTYFDLTDYVYDPEIKCKEGRRELWEEKINPDQKVYRRVICRKGKWVTRRPGE